MSDFISLKKKIGVEVLKLLGFSSKNGSLLFGKEMITEHFRKKKGKNKTVFLSEDISQKNKAMWNNKADYYNCTVFILEGYSMRELGKRLGKINLSAVATKDKDIQKGIEEKIKG